LKAENEQLRQDQNNLLNTTMHHQIFIDHDQQIKRLEHEKETLKKELNASIGREKKMVSELEKLKRKYFLPDCSSKYRHDFCDICFIVLVALLESESKHHMVKTSHLALERQLLQSKEQLATFSLDNVTSSEELKEALHYIRFFKQKGIKMDQKFLQDLFHADEVRSLLSFNDNFLV
jgi:hypothetical protein